MGIKGQIDVLIAIGTDTGKSMAANDHNIPTLIMSISDAVKSGISKSKEDSGLDYINVGVFSLRFTTDNFNYFSRFSNSKSWVSSILTLRKVDPMLL